jgi:hypothetical protein
MEYVYEMTQAAPNACIEVGRRTGVLWLPVKRHPALADFLYHGSWVIFCGTIVHNLNLHLLGTGILLQDAFQILPKILGAVVGGDHH